MNMINYFSTLYYTNHKKKIVYIRRFIRYVYIKKEFVRDVGLWRFIGYVSIGVNIRLKSRCVLHPNCVLLTLEITALMLSTTLLVM